MAYLQPFLPGCNSQVPFEHLWNCARLWTRCFCTILLACVASRYLCLKRCMSLQTAQECLEALQPLRLQG